MQSQKPEVKTIRKTQELFILGVIIGGAFLLRCINLGGHGFWQDEVVNLLQSENLKGLWLEGEFASNHTPLFGTLLALWRWVIPNENEWWIRSLSALLGTCGVVGVYLCTRLMFGPLAAIYAAIVTAVSPFHIYHSQDLKDYILIASVAGYVVAAFYYAAIKNTVLGWVTYGFVATLACYSSMFAAPLLCAINGWFIFYSVLFHRNDRFDLMRKWFVANLIVAVSFLPYLHVSLRQVRDTLLLTENYWIKKPSFWSIVFFLKTVAFGYSDREPWFKFALLFFGVGSVYGLLQSFRIERRAAWILLTWFFVPIGGIYLISQLFQSIFLIRALLPFAIPVFIYMGIASTTIQTKSIRYFLLGILFLISGISQWDIHSGRFPLREWPHRPGVHPPQEYREAAKYIKERMEKTDVIFHAGPPSWYPFYWYGIPTNVQYVVSPNPDAVRYVHMSNPHSTTRNPDFQNWFMRFVQPIAPERGRVWFVGSEWEREYYEGNVASLWRWLDAHYVELDHVQFKDFDVILYSNYLNSESLNILRRNYDDGVSAVYTFKNGGIREYKKTFPDFSLVPIPPEMRRGELFLGFDVEHSKEIEREVRFFLENRSVQLKKVLLTCVFSHSFIELASLREINPEDGTWRIVPMPNLEGPPKTYDISVWQYSPVSGIDQSGVQGSFVLAAGVYRPFLFAATTQLRNRDEKGFFRLTLDEEGVFGDYFSVTPWNFGWTWFSGSLLNVSNERICSLKLDAIDNPQWGCFAYLALLPVLEDSEDALYFTHREISLEAKQRKEWSLVVPMGAKRVDIVVFEHGERGKAYHIYSGVSSR